MMAGNLVASVIEYLQISRAANRNNWKGRCLDILTVVYHAYLKSVRLGLYKATPGITGDEVRQHLLLGIEYAYRSGVDGDIAEFGTGWGHSAFIIATALAYFAWKKPNFYLFDSFEGLPAIESPVDRDCPSVVERVWTPGSCKVLSQQELIKLCAKRLPPNRIKVHAGWFRDTLTHLPDDTLYAMLHIDCDLYQSTIDVLDVCFSRGFISEGAIIFFDDWNTNRASTKFGERRAWQKMVEKYAVRHSDEGPYAWNGHKFIVHAYTRK